MASNALEATAGPVWRMSVGRQAQFVVLTLMMIAIGAVMGGGTFLYREYQVAGVVVICGTAAVATWSALQLRSSLRLADNALIVRTATKAYEIPLQQLTRVSSGKYGIYMYTSDGRRITSQVAARSGWSQGFGLETRASSIVAAINSARQSDQLEADKGRESAGPDHVPVATSGVAAPTASGDMAAQPARARTDRLAKTVRISALMTALGAACLIGWFFAVAQVQGAADSLLAHGTRVAGMVTDWNGYHIDVRFLDSGKPVRARIDIAQGDVYHKGQLVTVVYDPGHPDRARTIREDGESQSSGTALSIFLVVSLFLLIGGISNLIRARRQLSRLRPSTT